MSFQGIELTPEMRKLVINVKRFFSEHKKRFNDHTNNSGIALAAKAMGVSESTVGSVMAAYNKSGDEGLSSGNPTSRGKPCYSIDANLARRIRSCVREANRSGRQVTIDTIKHQLGDVFNLDVSRSTLGRTLLRWGFEFRKGTRSAHLKESENTIIKRRKYLRAKLANRQADGSTIRPEIYLDESYINKNHSRDSSWFFDDEKIISKPTGKGERLIIVNAISNEGWIPNAKLVFQSKGSSKDYLSNMNWTLFRKWFTEMLLPNIPKNSVIILDNAQYHNVLSSESFP